MARVATNRRILKGEDNQEFLLDPIDTDLRLSIILHGEMIGAVADAYNDVSESESYRYSRYPPEELFAQVGLEKGNPFKYQVTKYFYMRSDLGFFGQAFGYIGSSAWIGIVAASTDEEKEALGKRNIAVCWRGTRTPLEWLGDFIFPLTPAADIFGNISPMPQVHYGFYNCYTSKSSISKYNKTSARDQVLSEIRRLVKKYEKEDVTITVAGHSLGAALATLNAIDIVYNGLNKPTELGTGFPVKVYASGSPRVGDENFLEVFNGLSDLDLLRIRNANDVVLTVPPKEIGFVDVGKELDIDSSKSPYLKVCGVSAHSLEIYLHTIAGYQGKDEDFKLVVDYDIALVNKRTDALLDTYKIPANWWIEKNYGMVQKDDGSWGLNDYVPPPPSDDDTIDENIILQKKDILLA